MAAPKDTKEEDKQSLTSKDEDKVEAAYENISKKLESIRSGKTPEDDEEESDESKGSKESEDLGDEGLEEWKGPKGMKSEEEEEPESQKQWEPVKDDPLDEEDQKEESKDSKESEETEENEEEIEVQSDKETEELKKSDPQPDTLDDLTEEEYHIPNLKASRQEGTNIGYNTPSEKSSMETTNDPNIFFSQHNQPVPPKRANKFHLLILVVIGVAVIGFTVYILKGGFGEIGKTLQPSPSPSEQASSAPTPTPTPEPERSKYKVRVLNGSGKTGLAKTVSEKLKELGYQIDKTGNATNSAFTQTLVRVKPDNESFIQQVVQDLTPDYEAGGNISLKDDDAVDIEIILGAK